MIVLLFVIHVAIAIALVGVILLQKSEGGALGMGGGGMSGFMTGRSTANLLTRTTGFLAIAFFVTSVMLVVLSNRTGGPRSLIDQGPAPSTQETPTAPASTSPGSTSPAPAVPAPTTAPAPEPAKPAEPSAPMAK
jgi:preprotein translocase subunit SecG